jgi:hypothetical protein
MDRSDIITLIESELILDQEPEINLMRAVIKQAFLDLLVISDKPKYQRLKIQAQDWLAGDAKDFELVCTLALVSSVRIKMLYYIVDTCMYSNLS